MDFIYKVVTENGEKLFENVEDLKDQYTQVGDSYRPGTRDELQGQPILKNLLGPMYDGTRDGNHVIRYESQQVYNYLSR